MKIVKINGGKAFAVEEKVGKFGAALREATGPDFTKAEELLRARQSGQKPEYQELLEQRTARQEARQEAELLVGKAMEAGIKILGGRGR